MSMYEVCCMFVDVFGGQYRIVYVGNVLYVWQNVGNGADECV